VLPVGQRDVGTDALRSLSRPDIVDRRVGCLRDHPFRAHPPAEDDAPQLVEHRLGFPDVRRRDEGMQDDARPASVHHLVIVIAQAGPLAARPHQGGVGVGRAHALITLALIGRGGWALRIEAAFLP
jgi:hypothetical protein